MTLLAYMPNPTAPPLGLPELETLIDELSVRIPGAFFIPVSQKPPCATRPRADRDWVLMPADMHLASRSGLLHSTYRWFEANVALFLGRTAEAEFHLFEPNALGRPGHKLWWDGSRWALDNTQSLSGDPLATLAEFLASRLPVVTDAGALADENWIERYGAKRAGAELRVFVRDTLNPAQRQCIVELARRYPRRVSLRVRLHKGLTTASGIMEVRELLRADPPLDFTVLAENPLFAKSAEFLTRTLTRSLRHCQAVTAPRAG